MGYEILARYKCDKCRKYGDTQVENYGEPVGWVKIEIEPLGSPNLVGHELVFCDSCAMEIMPPLAKDKFPFAQVPK